MTFKPDYMDRFAAVLLKQASSSFERLAIAKQMVIDASDRLDRELMDLIAAELRQTEASELQPFLSSLSDSINSSWLRTQLAQTPQEIEAAWRTFQQSSPRPDPAVLIAWARALADIGEPEQAIQKLSLALAQPVSYALLARSEKLVKQLRASVKHWTRQSKIAILGTSTTSLLVPVVEALCLRDGIQAQFYQGLYGAIQQEILDPASGLHSFRPNIVFVNMNWRDLHLDAINSDEAAVVERTVKQQRELWTRLSEAFGCHVVQAAFDFPSEDSAGYLSSTIDSGRSRLIEQINRQMREEAPTSVSILDLPAAQRRAGSLRWEDAQAWIRFRQHPSTEALPEVAELFLSHIRAVLGLTRKVLVTDLDNTMWDGIIGEDGLEGIGIGQGTPKGEAHLQLQRYLLELKNRGILLAVCSKNNPEDARLPFEKHPGMALKLDDFAGFRTNWEDKASNLRALAKELSLGLDSFVFIDDNPLEREWVRSQIPEVAVIELGASPFSYVRDIDRGYWFQTLSLSAEDLARAEQYRIQAQRENIRSTAGSLEEFLAQLHLEAEAEPVNKGNLTRITQLVNKTNQFNVTTKRYTEAQVQALADDPRGWAAGFRLSDRMGSYGLIGVIFCKPHQSANGLEWHVDSWLMSCRVLGRQMEKFMFDRMIEAAMELGVRRIVGQYIPTQKNSLVKDLFDNFGFDRTEETPEGKVTYELTVPPTFDPTATHVRNVGRPARESIAAAD